MSRAAGNLLSARATIGDMGAFRFTTVAPLVLIYVLSIGPAEWLVVNRHLSDDAIDFYRPVFALADKFKPADRSLVWYIRLWTPGRWAEPGDDGRQRWTLVFED